MLKFYKCERFFKKFSQLKHIRKYGQCDPCRKPCPPSFECKQPQTDPDMERLLAQFAAFVHPFLRCHKPKDYRTYKNITLFICIPLVTCFYFCLPYMSLDRRRPKFIKYEYMRIRNKPFPWSSEGKTLFHNPYYNALPDGYEFEVPEDEEFDPRTKNCRK